MERVWFLSPPARFVRGADTTTERGITYLATHTRRPMYESV